MFWQVMAWTISSFSLKMTREMVDEDELQLHQRRNNRDKKSHMAFVPLQNAICAF